MQYSLKLDLVKIGEWGINTMQGCLVGFLTQAASWAKPVVIEDTVWYWCSKTKILEELGTVFNTKDTVYRNVKILQEKGIINYRKMNEMDLFNLSEKGKQWLKKDNDTDLGKNSELSEKIPNNIGKNSDISYNQDHKTNNHPPLPPQGADEGDFFDKIFETYTTAPSGCITGRASDYDRAKREFEKIQDVNASDLVKIIKAFWQHDDAWRRGYQPSFARFLSEKQYRNQPRASRQHVQPAQLRATAYLTPEQEMAKEQETNARLLKLQHDNVKKFEQDYDLDSNFAWVVANRKFEIFQYMQDLRAVNHEKWAVLNQKFQEFA